MVLCNSACEGWLSSFARRCLSGSSFNDGFRIEYVAEHHGDPVEQWNGRRIFKQATEGDKICMAGIDRMVTYLGKDWLISPMWSIQRSSSLEGNYGPGSHPQA